MRHRPLVVFVAVTWLIPAQAVTWQLRLVACITGLVAIALAGPARAEVSVKPPFASSMVLQREMAVPIWGTASGGEQVSVTVASQTKTVTAPANGTTFRSRSRVTR